MPKNTVEPMTSRKNKLNNEINLIFNLNPNTQFMTCTSFSLSLSPIRFLIEYKKKKKKP